MDIKPFQELEINVWTDLGPLWIILAVIGIILLVGGPVLSYFGKGRNDGWAVAGFLLGMIVVMSATIAMNFSAAQIKTEAYKAHLLQVKDGLEKDGFKIISGTLNLYPNTQSDMLLAYQGKNFDCTLFAPEDLSTNIVFSCGEAKLTLEQIQESK